MTENLSLSFLHVTLLDCIIFVKIVIPSLRYYLSHSVVSLSSVLIGLPYCIRSQDLKVSILFKGLLVWWNFKSLCDNSHMFWSIESGVVNLSLEWEMSDLWNIQVDHFQEIFNWLQLIFKSQFCVIEYVAKIFV